MQEPFEIHWVTDRRHLSAFYKLISSPKGPLIDWISLIQLVAVLALLVVARVDPIIMALILLLLVMVPFINTWRGWIRWVSAMQKHHSKVAVGLDGLHSPDGTVLPWSAISFIESGQIIWLTVPFPLSGIVVAKDELESHQLNTLRTRAG